MELENVNGLLKRGQNRKKKNYHWKSLMEMKELTP